MANFAFPNDLDHLDEAVEKVGLDGGVLLFYIYNLLDVDLVARTISKFVNVKRLVLKFVPAKGNVKKGAKLNAQLQYDFLSYLSELKTLLLYQPPGTVFKSNFNLGNNLVSQIDITDVCSDDFDLTMFPLLQQLSIYSFKGHNLSFVIPLKSLRSLVLGGMVLSSLSGVESLRESLESLKISQCRSSSFERIDPIVTLTSLKELHLAECRKLQYLPNLSNLKMLRKLLIDDCGKFVKIEGLENMSNLEEIVVNSKGIEDLEWLLNPPLRVLKVMGSSRLLRKYMNAKWPAHLTYIRVNNEVLRDRSIQD